MTHHIGTAEYQREVTRAKLLRAQEDRRDARSQADYMAAVLAT